MEFPFNHNRDNVTHTHHHNNRRRNDNEESPNYPPPGTEIYHTGHVTHGHVSQGFNHPTPLPYPPPPETQVFHTGHVNRGHVSHVNYDPPPPPPPIPFDEGGGCFKYGYPSSHDVTIHHIGHESGVIGVSQKSTVRVVTKASPNYSLTIRHGQLILAPYDPTDQYQHWYKDERYSTRVKDSEGCPAFSLINKATGEAIKHSIGATHPVNLIPYNPDFLDESVLWTESRDMGDGHRTVRMVNNVRLNMDAFHGDKNSGGVHEGTTIVLWEWNKGDNQLWKILPY
ncbi:hypothetical protein Lal_00044690 [Lupinus albus]|nr:hypothetical protein Lal_00044690 [Lupinus albus]